MAFIKILIIVIGMQNSWARIDLPKFATKLSLDNIRFMTFDGRFTYTQKRSGSLSLTSSFRSVDVLERPAGTNYHITGSESRKKLIIEVESAWHQNLDLTKLNEILVGTYATTNFMKIGLGRFPRLHLDDDWATWYDPKERVIHVQSLRSSNNHHKIFLSKKHNAFFFPEVVMLNPETVLYTDINEKGFAALLSWNLIDKRMTVVRKADVTGTRFELCRRGNYVALGEFSYDGVNKGSAISVNAWSERPNLSGFATIYKNSDNDIGQMLCDKDKIWFVKTMSEDRKLNIRISEAVTMDIAKGNIIVKSELERVANIIDMDGRILIPFREDFYVAEGDPGTRIEKLQAPPKSGKLNDMEDE
jgi:hypothetical protein